MPDTFAAGKALAIIGNEEIVLGFKALGFNTYSPKTPEELKNILEGLAKESCSLCLVQEDLYKTAQGEIDSFKSLPLPIFVPFSKDGSTEGLKRMVKDIRLRATGKL